MTIRIVHMSSVHPVFDNRIYFKECMTLAKEGFEVFFVVPHDQDNLVEGPVKIVRVQKPQNRISRFVITTFMVFLKAIQLRAQIYHLHDPELLPYALILRLMKKTVIYDMHENMPLALKTKKWISPILRHGIATFFQKFEKFVCKRVSVLFAELSYQGDYSFVKNSETVLNYPQIQQLSEINVTKRDVPTVVYIGSVTEDRGVIKVLEALKLLRQEDKEIYFECIGPCTGVLKNKILTLAKEYGVTINIYDFLPSNVGLRIVKSCHVGLAVLRRIPNYTDSFPTKIFEYMALGLPVITSDFSLYKQLVEEKGCGICIDPENAVALKEAIKKIITDKECANLMIHNGMKTVTENYSWENEAAKLIKFYRKQLECY